MIDTQYMRRIFTKQTQQSYVKTFRNDPLNQIDKCLRIINRKHENTEQLLDPPPQIYPLG